MDTLFKELILLLRGFTRNVSESPLDIEGLACLHQSLLDDFFAQYGIVDINRQSRLIQEAARLV